MGVGTFNVAGDVFGTSIVTNQVYTLIYSQLYGGFLLQYGALYSGNPWEIMWEACTRASAGGPAIGAFLNFSVGVTDASVTAFAQAAAAGLPGLPVATEFGNEFWNSSAGVYGQADCLGTLLGFGISPNTVYGFQGLRSSQTAQLFRSAWTGAGRSRSDLYCTLQCWVLEGEQAGGFGQMQNLLWNGAGLVTSNTTYAAIGGAGWTAAGVDHSTGSPTFSRPIDYHDAIGYAPYTQGTYCPQGLAGTPGGQGWSGALSDQVPLLQASSDYAYGGPTGQTSALNAWDADYRSGTYTSGTGTNGTGSYGYLNVYWHLFANPNFPVFVGVIPGFEARCAGYDGLRPSGFQNISVIQYEAGLQQTVDTNSSGATTNPGSIAGLVTRLTANSPNWNVSPYTNGNGDNKTIAATNIVNLLIAYLVSTQYQNTVAYFLAQQKSIHAARPLFCPATYGLEGGSVWQQLVGPIGSTPMGNELAFVGYNH